MVQSIERALDVLEALVGANSDLGINELQSRTTLAPSTLHRLLKTLVASGYAAQDESTRRYGPGFKVLELAASARRHDRFNLRRVARPVLRALSDETGETSSLVIRTDSDITYVEQAQGVFRVRTFAEIGHRAPIYATASGKAMLSLWPEADVDAYLENLRFEPFTKSTLTSAEQFRRELIQIRKKGFAVDNEEFEAGVRCVAAAVRSASGRPVAAISLSGPSSRLTRPRLQELGPIVANYARDCSTELGYGV